MEKQPLKYVSPEYQEQLDKLAETLCIPDRFKEMGQLVLFPLVEVTPPEAA